MDDPRFIRQPEQEAPAKPGSETVDLGDGNELVKLKPDALVIDLPDGKVTINFGGLADLLKLCFWPDFTILRETE